MSQSTAPRAPHTPWGRSVGLGVVLSAVVCLVVLAFSWPSVTLDPKDLPVAIAGPAAAVQPVEAALQEQGDGAFALIEVADRDAAVQAIRTREAYGAIVVGQAPEVLTSSAAGIATNQLMTQLHEQLAAMVPPQTIVPLTDVVPLSPDDPRGAGLTAAALPLVFGGMIGGIGIATVVSGAWRRIVALLVYAVVGGLAIAGIMSGWFGVLPGDFWATAGTFSLTLAAMGATIVGFAALFGRPGIAVGPVLFMLIGNPISGASFPKEFYPQPWGAIGQLLPPGAGATLLRDVSYFPDADVAVPILVLTGWAVLGLVLIVVGHFRDQGRLVLEESREGEAVAA